MIKEGCWWLCSKEDPRWNCKGRDYVGGFELSTDQKEAFEKKKKELGEPPDDLEWGYMKD
jgi:hypothetical protein